VGTAEIELYQIAVKVLFLTVLVDAFQAALIDQIEAFNRVRREVSAHNWNDIAMLVLSI
jgi:hypothetical protein